MPLATFSGLASGIDSAALIQALMDERRKVKIKPLQRDISEISTASQKLSELRSLAQKLRDKAQMFSPAYGGPVVKKATSSNENVLTVSVSSSAINGSYSINISQLAKTSTTSFDTVYSQSSDPLIPTIDDNLPDADRTITISFGQGSNQISKNFILSSSTTVSDFLEELNTQFSGVATAVLINVGTNSTPQYKILLKSSKTGLDEGMVSFSAPPTVDNAINSWLANRTVSQATDLTMTVTGISGTITKSSNTFSDLIPGVTITAKETGSSNITVETDTGAMSSRLQEFVNAFNELVRFVRKENRTTISTNSKGEQDPKFGALGRVRVDDSFVEQLRRKLSEISAYDDPAPPQAKVFKLSDIGLSTTGKDQDGAFDGTLVFQSSGGIGSFMKAIEDDFQGVVNLLTKLGNELGTTTGLIDEYVAFGKLFDQTINSLNQEKSNLEARLQEAEKALLAEEQNLAQIFARLESTMGRLRSLQANLASALAQLPRYDK